MKDIKSFLDLGIILSFFIILEILYLSSQNRIFLITVTTNIDIKFEVGSIFQIKSYKC